VIVLADGKLTADGPVRELKQIDDPWLRDYFSARAPMEE
jgi:phospholipid/cholesterol/gamma-HCH transport system ATP-binding protein